MTPLRQQMIDAMQVRGFSARTHQSYLSAVSALAQYYNRTPEQLSIDEIQAYFLYLVKERGLSGATCRLYLNAIRFLYLQVLKQTTFDVPFHIPKKAQRIPELLTRLEVSRILSAVSNAKHRMMLMTCYGCGLRVSELVALKVCHIDSERQLLRIEQGKGGKDRQVILPATLLQQLRAYWRQYRPRSWFFPHGISCQLSILHHIPAFLCHLCNKHRLWLHALAHHPQSQPSRLSNLAMLTHAARVNFQLYMQTASSQVG